MTRKAGIAFDLCRSLAERFPQTPTKTLARKAYAESPALWSNLEGCRNMIRYIRGKTGDRCRKSASDKTKFDSEARPTAVFPKLPPGIKSLEDWRAEVFTDVGRWLVLSDVHVPYHDTDTIRAVWTEARRRKIVGILLNGDIADCFSISRWEKDPRKRDFANEIETTKKFFDALVSAFPKARIIWKAGNHELRFQSYMQTKAPELLDIADFKFDRITGAESHGIQYFDDNRPIKLGKLSVLHGHEYRFAISNPVNPARGLFLRARVSAMMGHLHQSSSHSEKDLEDHVTTCWSTGCLCDIRPEYAPLNKWNHGAAFVELSSDGAFSVDNFRVFEGRVYS